MRMKPLTWLREHSRGVIKLKKRDRAFLSIYVSQVGSGTNLYRYEGPRVVASSSLRAPGDFSTLPFDWRAPPCILLRKRRVLEHFPACSIDFFFFFV